MGVVLPIQNREWNFFYAYPHLPQYKLWICHINSSSLSKLFTFSSYFPNNWSNFNQTWHKKSLGEGDSSLFKWRAWPFSKGGLLWNREITLTNFKNLLLKNHWANFNQIWHKSSLGNGDSSLFKCRAHPPYPREDN